MSFIDSCGLSVDTISAEDYRSIYVFSFIFFFFYVFSGNVVNYILPFKMYLYVRNIVQLLVFSK